MVLWLYKTSEANMFSKLTSKLTPNQKDNIQVFSVLIVALSVMFLVAYECNQIVTTNLN
jgi:hypothetical protein